jgi:hypothetical protein
MTRVRGTSEAIVCSADRCSVSAAMAISRLPGSKMSYLARPGSILAGWRIRNSLTAKGSSTAPILRGICKSRSAAAPGPPAGIGGDQV